MISLVGGHVHKNVCSFVYFIFRMQIAPTFIPVFVEPFQSTDCDSVQVTLEDQQKINIFARKTNKLGELQAEIQTKQVRLLSVNLSYLLKKELHIWPLHFFLMIYDLKISEQSKHSINLGVI